MSGSGLVALRQVSVLRARALYAGRVKLDRDLICWKPRKASNPGTRLLPVRRCQTLPLNLWLVVR